MSTLERIKSYFLEPVVKRDVEPLEGTRMSLWNSIIPNWWSENGMSQGAWFPGNATLADRVWVSNRCIQLNAQQIASMPLEWVGSDGVNEPAWVSNPDPNWYPNGISDAVLSIVRQVYGWGFSCQQITSRYRDGYPQYWTVLPSAALSVTLEHGHRVYKLGEVELNPEDIVQIDRDPDPSNPTGTSAIRAFAQIAYGLLAAGNQAMSVQQGGVPQAVLKSQRKLTATQAGDLQTQWMTAVGNRNGAPAVLPPELDFEQLSFNPADLALLDTQEFDARMLCAAFGVPAFLLNLPVTGGLTYQNPGMLGEMWWRFELRPTAKRIADAFSSQMLPRGQFVRFDAEDTFAPLIDTATDEDDPQAAIGVPASAQATPAQQRLSAVGGGQ